MAPLSDLLGDLTLPGGASTPVLVLTGSGVSADSGVPTFRGAEGLWRSFRPQDLATPQAFRRDPQLVWRWYEWRRERIAAARPNPAHLALAALEQLLPVTLVTQNVDGLHELAGSKRVIELHGSLWRTRCTVEETEEEDRRLPLPELPPRCRGCGALLRPAVVWYGEPIDPAALDTAFAAAAAAGLVLVVGTSSVVEPAASIALAALESGAVVIEVNPEPTPLSPHATHSLRAEASETVPAIVAALEARLAEGR